MECSTKAIAAMAEILVKELEQVGLEDGDIRAIETGMRAILHVVGAKALGQYLEQEYEVQKKREWSVNVVGRRWNTNSNARRRS